MPIPLSVQGTTLIYIATDAYNKYVAATGAVYDGVSTGLLAITEEQYEALQPLGFNIGSAGSYSLPPNAQIWPRALNTYIGGNDSVIYLIVADVSTAPSRARASFLRIRGLMSDYVASLAWTQARASTSSTGTRSLSGSFSLFPPRSSEAEVLL
jgi:hypothetical protein